MPKSSKVGDRIVRASIEGLSVGLTPLLLLLLPAIVIYLVIAGLRAEGSVTVALLLVAGVLLIVGGTLLALVALERNQERQWD
jgi:hypothetical protein